MNKVKNEIEEVESTKEKGIKQCCMSWKINSSGFLECKY